MEQPLKNQAEARAMTGIEAVVNKDNYNNNRY